MAQQASKPFDIQSPQKIAMEYGGNKQKIAQAMQLGIVDSTAGVLAGMFIDKMRAAQMQEQMPQATIAQQVMGGAQPSPAAGAPPAGGLGAASQGAPPMAPPPPPQGGMPPAPPMGAPPQGAPPMGMADGGLASLPIPDNMFDESDNGGYGDGYSGGGLVAFAEGGPLGPWFEETAVAAIPGINIAGRARTAERNRQVGGVSGSFHIGDNARDFTPPPGMSLTQLGDRLKQLYGPGYDVIYNTKGHYDHVHVEPGPELGRKIRGGEAVTPNIPERDIGTAAGRFGAPWIYFEALQKRFGPTPEEQEIDTARMARAKELASPEYQDKIRKQDMWEALAQIGFNMASSKSPYLLQAVGEAAAAALPGARVARKEREALKDRALDAMGAMNGARRRDNLALFGAAVDMAKAGQQQEQFERGLEEKGVERRHEMDMLERKIDAELSAARISASAKDRDLMTTAVMNKYAELQKINAGRPMKQANEPFDPYRHRLADETVFDNAFKSVIGTRYPKTSGDTGYGLPGGGGAAPSNQYSGFTAEQVG